MIPIAVAKAANALKEARIMVEVRIDFDAANLKLFEIAWEASFDTLKLEAPSEAPLASADEEKPSPYGVAFMVAVYQKWLEI